MHDPSALPTDGARRNRLVWDANDIFMRSLYGHIHIELKQYVDLDCCVNNA